MQPELETGEFLGDVGVIFCNSVFDHIGKTLVITACFMGQTLDCVDFPAVIFALCGGKYGNESFRLGKAGVFG